MPARGAHHAIDGGLGCSPSVRLKLDTCDFWAAQLDGADPDTRGPPRSARRPTGSATSSSPWRFTDPDVTARVLSGAEPAHQCACRRDRADHRSAGASTAARIGRRRCSRWKRTAAPTARRTGRRRHLRHRRPAQRHLSAADAATRPGAIDAIAAIPGDGIDYGLLRYLRADTAERLQASSRTAGAAELPRPDRTSACGGDALRPDRALLAGSRRCPNPISRCDTS